MPAPQSIASTRKFDPILLIEQLLNYAKHGRLMAILFVFGILTGIGYFVYTTPLYESQSLVYLRYFGLATGSDEGLPTSTGYLQRSLTFTLGSDAMLLRAARNLGYADESTTAEDVKGFIPIVRVAAVDSTHIGISVMSEKPDLVRTFPEALIEAYRDYQTENWTKFRRKALELYSKDVEAIETELNRGLQKLSDFERDERLTEVTIEQESLLEIPKEIVIAEERLSRMLSVRTQVEALDRDLTNASTEKERETHLLTTLSLLAAFEKEKAIQVGDLVRRNSGGGPVSEGKTAAKIVVEPSMVSEVEQWRELEKRKRVLDQELAEASKQYLPDHSIMVNLAKSRLELIRSMEAELTVVRTRFDLEQERLQERLAELKRRLPDYYAVTDKLTRSTREYSSMNQTQKLWDSAFQRLSDKLAALDFNDENREWADLQFEGHTRLRDDIPVSPNKKKLIMMAILVGLVGALGVPTLVNLMNTTFTRTETIENLTGLPGIGIVPMTSKEILEEVHRSPAQGAKVPNFLLENFRLMRGHILLDPVKGHRTQVVMVTSSRPREGKTTLAANLAWAFHSMGDRTLLIDCDLRRGRVHSLTQIENSPGMTHLLLGDCTPEQAIQPSATPLLDLLPRGPVIPGTTELLCQMRFEDLLRHFRSQYARIVIDSPPVLGLSETTSLQRLADGVILVVRAEATSRKDVQDALHMLRKAGAHFYGFVLNAVDLSKLSNYYSYYYYSSAYYDQLEGDPHEGTAGLIGDPRQRGIHSSKI